MPLRVVTWFAVVCGFILLAPAAALAQPSRALNGVVVDADSGAPLTGASVTVKDGKSQAAVGTPQTSNADGAFTIAKAPQADLLVEVTAEGYQPVTLPVKAGKAATMVAVALRKVPPPPPPQQVPTRSIAGLVRDAQTGAPIAGAQVVIAGSTTSVLTDADGLFTIDGVGMSDVALQISAEGYNATSVEASAEAPTVKAMLEPGAGAPVDGPRTRSLRGKLTEALSSEPVVGATVTVRGTENTTISDENGQFQLDGVLFEDVTLDVQAEGYQPAQITALATATEVLGIMDFAAASEQIVLEGRAPVIVRSNLANGASVVDDEDLNRVSASTVESAMVGKVSGANLQSNSGAPGGGTQLRLRGISTINGQSSPLYVIDGVILSNVAVASGVNAITAAAAGGSASNQDNPVNRIADLNPNDIESVEVLKGASAAALYGSKAANGVVIIRTKRGRAGQNKASVTQRVGFSQVSNTLGSRRFGSQQEVMDAYNSQAIADLYTGQTFDHEQAITRSSLAYETVASASGGNDKGTYHGSILVRDEPGVVIGTFYQKQSARIGTSFQFGKRLSLDLGASVLHSTSDRGLTNNDNTGTSYYVALSSTPSFLDLRRGADGRYPENPLAGSNPLQTVALFQNEEDVWRVITSANAALDVYKTERDDVKLVSTFGVDRFQQRNDVFSTPELQFEPSDGQPGTAIEGTTNNLNWNLGVGALWRHTPASGKFKNALSVGLTFESVDLLTVSVVGTNLSQPNIDTATSLNVFETALRTKDQGIYVQEELALLDDRLSLLGGLLAERSSLNGDSDKFFIYPKVAATYEVEVPEETFDLLRVRGAFGQAGNRPNYGQKFTPLNATQTIEGMPTLTLGGTVGDTGIEPERQTEVELGTDVALKDQRAVLELTAYQRNISNLLSQRAVELSSGYTTIFENSGSLRNRGIEAAVQVTPVEQAVTWTTRGILTLNRSEVTDLPGGAFNVTTVGFGAGLGAFRIEEGKSATQIVSDVDGDGVLDVVGNGEPDFRVGWSNKVTWKQLELNTLLDWQKGSDIVNLTKLLYDFGQVSPDYIGAGEARLDAFSNGDISPYIEDASFVKLREVAVAYNLPAKLAKDALSVDWLRVSLSGRNLLTWTSYSGLDPEVSNFGNQPIGRNYDVAPYPPSRSFWLSVEAGL
ncbi:MAG: SusC/RagA family TonB-linked outer membrane protein [Kofleriaceae bacterium]|nr:MAG: SusC/RagA family TonB-linked outer membrane protein [Kofleriaceae bacterium]MBZ0232115.1 SusC/RagA family TonB-linked outer membrane protein [Kofleriaceae bacterium]